MFNFINTQLALRGINLENDSLISLNNISNADSIAGIILELCRFLVIILGALAVLYIVWGAILFIISGGKEEKVKAGKATIINAIIGLVIAILSFTLVDLINTIMFSGTLNGILGG